jgi:hypothetical protein
MRVEYQIVFNAESKFHTKNLKNVLELTVLIIEVYKANLTQESNAKFGMKIIILTLLIQLIIQQILHIMHYLEIFVVMQKLL